MFSIRNKKRTNRSYTPRTRQSGDTVLAFKDPQPTAGDIGHYRPTSSVARSGKNIKATGKKNTHKAGTKFAIGSKPRLLSNTKKN